MTADDVTKAMKAIAPYVTYDPYLLEPESELNFHAWYMGTQPQGPKAFMCSLYLRRIDGVSEFDIDDWPAVFEDGRTRFEARVAVEGVR